MFNFLKKTDKNQIAQMLKTTPEALEAFENAYQTYSESEISDNLFEVNAKQAASEKSSLPENADISDIIDRITDELLAKTIVYDSKTDSCRDFKANLNPVSLNEIKALPEALRPQLTGRLMRRDISEPSYIALLDHYRHYLNEKNPAKKQQYYNMFRQGLDILDIDPIVYQIIGTNPNSMGYWLPRIVPAVNKHGFFKIPDTKIIKIPVPMLQLTRCDYSELTAVTRDIIDQFCFKAFELDENKDYFIKTGTYSSKYDFRNAHVHGAKEVRELGEYLLFIHFQANMMAAPTNNVCTYGVSTTNEWTVREFIEDKENNPCIYKGLPLHTEYRVFVDFDTKQVIGINPYWDADTMKKRFERDSNIHDRHDYIIYSMHEETLMDRYNQNKDAIVDNVRSLIQNIDMTGQWSIDIMQNGNDFYLIDMALAQNSALIECVPKELRRTTEENWLPKLNTNGSSNDQKCKIK